MKTYQKNGDAVQFAVNSSIVAGSTTVGGVAGAALMGPAGVGYGMLGGSLAGTYIKKQNYFGFT